MKLLKSALLATLLFSWSLFSFNNAEAATLSETPANIAPGGTVTATWSAIAAPTNRDWIGLYTPAAPDTSFIDWIYDNTCSKSGADTTPASGSCPFLIPSSLPNGTYELRLFANNNFIRLATSNPFNVGPLPPRFVDNGDGTITDDQTGLMWEKKTPCASSSATDIHCVNNRYAWSSTVMGVNPDGTLFTDFLARINTELSTSADGITVADVCFAGHCDWRVPNIAELRTILLMPSPPFLLSPWIDPIFGPVSNDYWSSTTLSSISALVYAWTFNFQDGHLNEFNKVATVAARAVRGAR